MSCYLHHLKDLFREAGVEYTRDSRKAVDARIRVLLSLPDAGCPVVWRSVKPMLGEAAGRARLLELVQTPSSSG